MKQWKFLYTWKQCHGAFIRPKLKWYFGPWWKEGNLPVWRRGPIIRFGTTRYYGESRTWPKESLYKYDYKETWNYGKLVDSEWTEEGKKRHPFLSKFLKPSYQLPLWLSFYFFNADIMYKTKWTDDDFRYEYPSHITLVFFGLCISVTAYIPESGEKDWTAQDDYWESLLTYNYYCGDLKKTNDVMGWWNDIDDENFRFRFQPRFLKNEKDQDDLVEIQADLLDKLRKRKAGEGSDFEEGE